jgi:hypothetical protein
VTNYDCKCGPIPIGVSNNCMWRCY